VAVRRRPRSARLLVVLLVSASLAVITLDYRQGTSGPLAGLGEAAQAAMAPLQEAVTGVIRPIEDFFSGLAHLPTLEDQNRALREQIEVLKTRIATDGESRRLYEELLGLLGLQQLNPDSVAATVIANGVSNFSWKVTIDQGTTSGIQIDQPVIVGTSDAPRLVGRIVRVTETSADVELIIDPDHAAAAILDGSRETGLIEGQGDRDLRMSLITPTTEIEGGERVFTEAYEVRGQQGRYPPDILIGAVARLVPADNELEAYVTVKPAVEFSDLRFVLVLKVPTEEPA
jgi:rod shape-determining protein MreC